MPKVVKCPALRCGSTDISPVGVSKKAGLGKGIIGAAAGALVNPVGAVVGGGRSDVRKERSDFPLQ